MRKSAKIWLVIAILLCACVTVLNFTEGRIPSVILALVEIAALVVLLVKEKKAGFWLLCGCYLLSFLTGVIGGITGGTGILLSVGCFGNRLGTDPRHHLAVPAQGSAQHALTPAPQFFSPSRPPGTGRDFYFPGKSASFCRRMPRTITSTAARCSSVSPVRSSPGSGGVRPSR